MKLKTAGRATAAVAAFGTVLGPMAASLPASASAARPATARAAAKAVGTARATRAAQVPGLCGGNSTFKLVSQSQLFDTNTGAATGDKVQLYYNSTTRCVYGKFLRSGNCNTPNPDCRAFLWASTSPGQAVSSCVVDSGQGACITDRFYDANITSAASASRKIPGQEWTGKTRWF
jgi:hypothetical protein